MIFQENRLLTDGSHEISYFFFSEIGKMWQNLASAAVMIGTLRVICTCRHFVQCILSNFNCVI